MRGSRSGLPRAPGTVVSKVVASVAAALVGSAIYAALPRAAPSEAPASWPAMTSGGKYAARAEVPAAFDGLDTMPTPRVTAVVAEDPLAAAMTAAETPLMAGAIRGIDRSGAPPLASADRPARAARPAHPIVRREARRSVATSERAPIATATRDAPPPGERSDDRAGAEEFVPGIWSTARDAFSATAAAGGSLVARVIPRIP